jgi:uncharacterized short protein YbdD (DUF466 family)
MRDYTPLRVLAAQKESVHLKSTTVIELLDELDTLRTALAAAPGKAKAKRNDYPADFEEVWAAYPSRPGSSKRAAFTAWSARIKAGATIVEMLAGVRKYANYVQAMKVEPTFIKQAETFFGPREYFSADWTVPEAQQRPAGGGAWWLSDTTRLAKAIEVGVGPAHSGESTAGWEARIRAAIDNGGKPPAPVQMIRPQVQPTPIAELMPAAVPARRNGKPEGLIQMMKEIGQVAPRGRPA